MSCCRRDVADVGLGYLWSGDGQIFRAFSMAPWFPAAPTSRSAPCPFPSRRPLLKLHGGNLLLPALSSQVQYPGSERAGGQVNRLGWTAPALKVPRVVDCSAFNRLQQEQQRVAVRS
jgi:hypothetical protein